MTSVCNDNREALKRVAKTGKFEDAVSNNCHEKRYRFTVKSITQQQFIYRCIISKSVIHRGLKSATAVLIQCAYAQCNVSQEAGKLRSRQEHECLDYFRS